MYTDIPFWYQLRESFRAVFGRLPRGCWTSKSQRKHLKGSGRGYWRTEVDRIVHLGDPALDFWENPRFRHCSNKGELWQMKTLNKCKITKITNLIINLFLVRVWSSPFVKLQYSCVLEIHKVWAPDSFCKLVIQKLAFYVDPLHSQYNRTLL